MLDWEWKPTRQPARSWPAAVVTTTSGASSDDMMLSNASPAAASPMPHLAGGLIALHYEDRRQRRAGDGSQQWHERPPAQQHGLVTRLAGAHGARHSRPRQSHHNVPGHTGAPHMRTRRLTPTLPALS